MYYGLIFRKKKNNNTKIKTLKSFAKIFLRNLERKC